MLKDFKWVKEGSYYSQISGAHEVTIELRARVYNVSLWKGASKELVKSRTISGTNTDSFLRAMVLGDQMIKQIKEKTFNAGK